MAENDKSHGSAAEFLEEPAVSSPDTGEPLVLPRGGHGQPKLQLAENIKEEKICGSEASVPTQPSLDLSIDIEKSLVFPTLRQQELQPAEDIKKRKDKSCGSEAGISTQPSVPLSSKIEKVVVLPVASQWQQQQAECIKNRKEKHAQNEKTPAPGTDAASSTTGIASSQASSSASGTRRTAERKEIPLDPDIVLQLLKMGFSLIPTTEAVLATSSVEQATEYILNYPPPLERNSTTGALLMEKHSQNEKAPAPGTDAAISTTGIASSQASSSASGTRRTAERKEIPLDPDNVLQLLKKGFSLIPTTEAVLATSSVKQATEYILNYPPPLGRNSTSGALSARNVTTVDAIPAAKITVAGTFSTSDSSAAYRTRTTAESKESFLNRDHLNQLLNMGFSPNSAIEALFVTNSVEQAAAYLLNYPPPLERNPTSGALSMGVDMDWEMEDDQMLRAISMSLGENVSFSTSLEKHAQNEKTPAPGTDAASSTTGIASSQASSSASGTRRTAERKEIPLDPDIILQLLKMGFSLIPTTEAVLATSSVEQATEYILNYPPPLERNSTTGALFMEKHSQNEKAPAPGTDAAISTTGIASSKASSAASGTIRTAERKEIPLDPDNVLQLLKKGFSLIPTTEAVLATSSVKQATEYILNYPPPLGRNSTSGALSAHDQNSDEAVLTKVSVPSTTDDVKCVIGAGSAEGTDSKKEEQQLSPQFSLIKGRPCKKAKLGHIG